MPVPSSIADLSTTAGSNNPPGSESPSLIDDYLRTQASFIALLRDQTAFAPQTIASAATTDIGAAVSNVIYVSGTTTITALGTAAAGVIRTVRFLAALTLTHNATSLILPGSANILTAANDNAEFLSLGSGNWQCIRYNTARSVVEYITNANGVAIKLYDGTMICTKVFAGTFNVNNAIGSVWYANLTSQSFASTFIAAPICGVASVYGIGAAMWGCGTSPTTTASGPLTIISPVSFASANLTISLIAIGRWF